MNVDNEEDPRKIVNLYLQSKGERHVPVNITKKKLGVFNTVVSTADRESKRN